MQDLDTDSLETLERRSEIGVRCTEIAHGSVPVPAEDRETAAKDAISDILTALYGPCGTYKWVEGEPSRFVPNDGAEIEAQNLLDAAFDSWAGDAEDYTITS